MTPAAAERAAVPLVLASAVMWGLWWAPVRWLEAAGLGTGWTTLAMTAGGALALGAVALKGPRVRLSRRTLTGCVLIGTAITLYGMSLGLTEVVRAVLLFYLAPAWSLLIEAVFLGRRQLWRAIPALAFSAAGMIAILGPSAASGGLSAGDAVAVASGLAWASGSALVFAGGRTGAGPLAAASGAAAFVVAALCLASGLLPTGGEAPVPALAAAVAAGAVYLGPVLLVAVWGATRLSPAAMSFLLTAEIASGVISSAIFLDEPFGMAEATGTVLIALGATLELRAQRPAPRA